jgi:hypothetical protein
MWRDLGQYLRALWKHLGGLATGTVLTVALLIWQYVLKKGDIPTWAMGLAVGAGLFISGFQAWREEHAKVAEQGDRRLQDLASRMVEDYVAMARVSKDAGPHALATLNLPALRSDALIRDTIQRMDDRMGTDTWQGWGRYIEDVDLVQFFTWVREHHLNLHTTTVEDVAKQVMAAGGHRPKGA